MKAMTYLQVLLRAMELPRRGGTINQLAEDCADAMETEAELQTCMEKAREVNQPCPELALLANADFDSQYALCDGCPCEDTCPSNIQEWSS